MEQETPESSAALTDNAQEALAFGQQLVDLASQTAELALRPWNAYQLAIALAVFATAHLLTRPIGRAFREWLRHREG